MKSSDIVDELGSKFGMSFANGSARFADPFMADSAQYIPKSMDNVWDYSYFLYHLNGAYRQANKRAVSYFLNGIEFTGEEHGDDKEQKTLTEILTDQVDIMGSMQLGGEERTCYGNSFFTHYRPFDRMLVDDRDAKDRLPAEYPVSLFESLGPVKYDYKTMKYEVTDIRDMHKAVARRARVKLSFRDRPSKDVSRFRLIRVDPRELYMVESPMRNSTRILRRFSQEIKTKVALGDPFYVNDIPIEFLEAISQDADFLYHQDHIFHLKNPTIIGLRNNGWGIPETLINYRALHHLQVLRRIDEAVGQDYVLPFRIFVPNLAGAGDNVMQDLLMSSAFKSEMRELIRRRRLDPYAIHALPYPVKMENAGSDSRSLVQNENVEYHTNSLLDSCGLPVELYKGSINIQNVPSTIRLFETENQSYYFAFNAILRWTANAIQDIRRAARLETRLKRSNMADQLEERGIYLQLAASGEISRARAYGAVNIENPMEEKKRRMREDLESMMEQEKMQKEYQQQQQAGALQNAPQQPGADPNAGYGAPGGGGGQSMTPLDLESQAAQLAAEWQKIPDNGTRAKAIAAVRATRPDLCAYAQKKLEETRAQAASQGRKSVTQPQS